MDGGSLELAKQGLASWRAGDFEALERLLDPAVTWRAFEPGEWDCARREDVLRTLRERYAQGFAEGPITLRAAGADAVIVVSHPADIGGPDWPAETATVMRFRAGTVVSMQDYRSEGEALASITAG